MLGTIDLTKRLDRSDYREQKLALQLQLRQLAHGLYAEKRPLVVIYEGWDAAGKGGNIRRVVEKLDPRGYHVYPIGAPEGDDATRHYLWRFWRRLMPPDEKQMVFFDRSWYGRVLVERVEEFASRAEWKRAYREINEFERLLTDDGMLLVKFWLHISREEQERRFRAREETPYKRWKMTDEDWRNRKKWEHYEEAVEDMLVKTSTLTAPWTIVEAENKHYARVKTMRTLVEHLEAALGPKPDADARGDS